MARTSQSFSCDEEEDDIETLKVDDEIQPKKNSSVIPTSPPLASSDSSISNLRKRNNEKEKEEVKAPENSPTTSSLTLVKSTAILTRSYNQAIIKWLKKNFVVCLHYLGFSIFLFFVIKNFYSLNSEISKLREDVEVLLKDKVQMNAKHDSLENKLHSNIFILLEKIADLRREHEFQIAELTNKILNIDNSWQEIDNYVQIPTKPTDNEPPSSWLFFNNNESDGSAVDFRQSQETFKKSINELKLKFPNQFRESWIQLSAAVSSIFEETSKRPMTILILLHPDLSLEFGNCFAKKIGGEINKAFNYNRPLIHLTGGEIERAETIGEIHDQLKSYFDNSGRVVTISQIGQIDNEDKLMIFHGFCDNVMAYEKRAAFIFTLETPLDILNEFEWIHWKGKQIAYEAFERLWNKKLSIDKRTALLSRITSYIILLEKGDKCL